MTFGDRLKELRISKDMTQAELAKKINLSKANVSKYEANLVEPNLETLGLMSVLFKVSMDYLLGKSDTPTKDKKSISDAEATEILKRKFIQHGIIKEGEDITEDQLEDYLKKLSTVLNVFKD